MTAASVAALSCGCCMHHPQGNVGLATAIHRAAQAPLPLAEATAAASSSPAGPDSAVPVSGPESAPSLTRALNDAVEQVLAERSESEVPVERSVDPAVRTASLTITEETSWQGTEPELVVGETELEGPPLAGPAQGFAPDAQGVPVAEGSCCSDGSVALYPGSCGSCNRGPGGGLSGAVLPLLSSRLACGSGCGEVYWGEWIADPPSPCEPCDDDGCWVEPATMHPFHNPYGGPVRRTIHHVKHSVHRLLHAAVHGHGSACGCHAID